MHVITKKRIKNFFEKHKDAKSSLLAWYKIVKCTQFENLNDLHLTFPAADQVGSCTVFNIGGNKYRLITVIHYNRKKVFIRRVMTHKEYDKGSWKRECGK